MINRVVVPSLLLIVILPFLISSTPHSSNHKRLVLISFDGFRYDTLNSTIAPNITKWADGGVLFENGVASQAVTFTAPNHMSIVTGLHEEVHGIVGNIFFDQEHKTFYDIYNLSSLSGVTERARQSHWYKDETIWQSNRKAGGHSAILQWPIGDVASGNDSHTVFYPWSDHGALPRWQQEVDTLIETLQNGTNFVAWYVSEPDHTLHGYGFYHGGHYRSIMADLDNLFGYFIKRLIETGLYDSTDIIFTADHGHAEIKNLDAVLCMDKFISGFAGFSYQVSDQTILAYTEEQAQDIYTALTLAVAEKKLPVKIMWTKDVPASWHFKHPTRLGQVMVVPEIGADARFACPWKENEPFHSSTHGHPPENKEMRAVLAMRGPSFAESVKLSHIPQNIDLFPLMGAILGIPLPPNNGTMESVAMTLRDAPIDSHANEFDNFDPLSTAVNIVLLAVPIIVLAITVGYIIQRVRRGPSTKKTTLKDVHSVSEPMV